MSTRLHLSIYTDLVILSYMSEYEAIVETDWGKFIIHFTDNEDLKNKLLQVSEFKKTIEESIGSILVKKPQKVTAGLEDIYAIEPDGSIKLLKYPQQKAALLRLASFVSPVPLTPLQLKKVTGIDNPGAYMTPKDFIANPDGTYTLSSDARTEVVSKTLPSLRAQK